MDAVDVEAYLERWREVERIEKLESRGASIQDRWRQLNAIKQRAARLGIKREDDDGEMEVFLLWASLRVKYDPY
jgi:hypothetical protein